jgi:hypothetical protein
MRRVIVVFVVQEYLLEKEVRVRKFVDVFLGICSDLQTSFVEMGGVRARGGWRVFGGWVWLGVAGRGICDGTSYYGRDLSTR